MCPVVTVSSPTKEWQTDAPNHGSLRGLFRFFCVSVGVTKISDGNRRSFQQSSPEHDHTRFAKEHGQRTNHAFGTYAPLISYSSLTLHNYGIRAMDVKPYYCIDHHNPYIDRTYCSLVLLYYNNNPEPSSPQTAVAIIPASKPCWGLRGATKVRPPNATSSPTPNCVHTQELLFIAELKGTYIYATNRAAYVYNTHACVCTLIIYFTFRIWVVLDFVTGIL